MVLAWLILTAVVFFVLSLTPRACTVSEDKLTVHTWSIPYRFDLRKAQAVEPVSREQMQGLRTVRLFGVGWPLRRFGWFHNPRLGTYLNLMNSPSEMWMVRFPHLKVVVSPSSGMEQAVAQLRLNAGPLSAGPSL